MTVFIDPSELRESSQLLKYIGSVVYKPLSGLEALTGADVMISPEEMPFPRNDEIILSHIRGGAKLIQLKFGHDLPSSIIDGRLNEALSRMLGAGAMPWQCLLLFIGMIGRDSVKGMVTVNGQLTYGNKPMQWEQVQAALNFWTERGGSIDFPLSSGKLIPLHFDLHQDHIDRFVSGEDTRKIWPKSPVFYDEIQPVNPHLKEWKIAQKLIIIDDLRPLLCAIPGARIGPERATAIWSYMEKQGIRQCFMGFLSIVRDESILNAPGIGKGTLKAIRWGLFRTLEERNER
jgi:hypothetical protein